MLKNHLMGNILHPVICQNADDIISQVAQIKVIKLVTKPVFTKHVPLVKIHCIALSK